MNGKNIYSTIGLEMVNLGYLKVPKTIKNEIVINYQSWFLNIIYLFEFLFKF